MLVHSSISSSWPLYKLRNILIVGIPYDEGVASDGETCNVCFLATVDLDVSPAKRLVESSDVCIVVWVIDTALVVIQLKISQRLKSSSLDDAVLVETRASKFLSELATVIVEVEARAGLLPGNIVDGFESERKEAPGSNVRTISGSGGSEDGCEKCSDGEERLHWRKWKT